jgi:hypothetical protein
MRYTGNTFRTMVQLDAMLIGRNAMKSKNQIKACVAEENQLHLCPYCIV